MASLHLSLLGEFHISLNGRPIDHLPTKKAWALLAYLAVEGRQPQSRSYLSTLLWPEKSDHEARHNLRQTFLRLRKGVPDPVAGPPHFCSSRDTIQLNPEGQIEVDVSSLEALLRACRQHAHPELENCPACMERLQEAAELYRGDFLDQFFVADCSEFENWAQTTRERLKQAVLDGLTLLTRYQYRHGDYENAQQAAQKQIDIDPLHESGYRQLMRVLALDGRAEDALAQYEQCRRRLADDLNLAPDQQTTALYRQILAERLEDLPPIRGLNRMYDRQEEIGRGLFSIVYRAVHPLMKREVAVKVIQPHYAGNPDFIRRFEKEAQAVASLEHPHIVRLYDYWREPHHAYLVMRYLPGGNLRRSMANKRWPIRAIGRLLDQIASALTAAHQQEIIHRDIKPDNILLDQEGNAYLADFGIAKDWLIAAFALENGAAASSITYASPEQAQGLPLTPRSDQYSLGVVLFELLTGRPPFEEPAVGDILRHHITDPLPDLANLRPDLPAALNAVIQRATAKEPADRYPTVQALADAFHQVIGTPSR